MSKKERFKAFIARISTKEYMTNLGKKLPILVVGLIITAFGVALLIKAEIGIDALTTFQDGLANFVGVPISVASTVFNLIFIMVALIFATKFVGIGTVVMGIMFGPSLGIFMGIVDNIITYDLSLVARGGLFTVGLLMMCIGVALFVTLGAGAGSTDCCYLKISEKINFKYRYIRMIADITLFTTGVILGAQWGVGSLIAAVAVGPLIGVFRDIYKKTFIKWLKIDISK